MCFIIFSVLDFDVNVINVFNTVSSGDIKRYTGFVCSIIMKFMIGTASKIDCPVHPNNKQTKTTVTK